MADEATTKNEPALSTGPITSMDVEGSKGKEIPARKKTADDGLLRIKASLSSDDHAKADNKNHDEKGGRKRGPSEPGESPNQRLAGSPEQKSPAFGRQGNRSRSRTRSISPPRERRRPSRTSRSPNYEDSHRYHGRSPSPLDLYRDHDRYRGYRRGRRSPRDRYRDRSADRYGRYEDYPRARRSRSLSRERYSYRHRSPSPKRSRRPFYDDREPNRSRDRYYSSSRRRYRSRSRSPSRGQTPSPPPRRRNDDGARTVPSNQVAGIAEGLSQHDATQAQTALPMTPMGVTHSTANAHPGVTQYPTYMAASPIQYPATHAQQGQAIPASAATNARYNAAQNNQQVITKSRRLYVGNLPFHAGLSEIALVHFFNALHMAAFGPSKAANNPPVLSVWLHQDGKFGFMETRSDQDAVNIMLFNGVSLHGRPLRVNRPSDYNPAVHNPMAGMLVPDKMNYSAVVELCNKLGGIAGPPPTPPANLIADDRTLNTEVESAPTSNGVTAAVEDPESKAVPGATAESKSGDQPMSEPPSSSPAPPMLRSTPAPPAVSGNSDTVVALRNIITSVDLDGADEDYGTLVDDIREECTQYGRIVSIAIPRKGAGRGTAYIGFSNGKEAKLAVEKLSERAFDNRVVKASVVSGAMSADEAARNAE